MHYIHIGKRKQKEIKRKKREEQTRRRRRRRRRKSRRKVILIPVRKKGRSFPSGSAGIRSRSGRNRRWRWWHTCGGRFSLSLDSSWGWRWWVISESSDLSPWDPCFLSLPPLQKHITSTSTSTSTVAGASTGTWGLLVLWWWWRIMVVLWLRRSGCCSWSLNMMARMVLGSWWGSESKSFAIQSWTTSSAATHNCCFCTSTVISL